MTQASGKTAIALTIAGSDSSGGAGIQADLKTFTALGVYGASVITALTAQNTRGVDAVHVVPAAFIHKQVRAVAGDLGVGAVKTGMLADKDTVTAVANAIAEYALRPLVVDPVMVATSGDMLLTADAIETVRRKLIPLAALITPNLAEAAQLLGIPLAANEDEMQDQATALANLGCGAVLLKGGHGSGDEAVDILVDGGRMSRLALPRIDTPNTHGTGCTLSAAITALLADGAPLQDAVRCAKDFVWRALVAGKDLTIGKGAGPVDHMFQIRQLHKLG